VRARFATSLLLIFAACGDDLPRDDTAPGGSITLVSYNLAQIDGGARAAAVVAELSPIRPDFVALEECVGCDGWLPGAVPDLAVTEPRAGVAIAYDASRWVIRATDILSLGDNDDGWGERVAQWALFSTVSGSESIYVYATHWCVTIRTPADPCTVDRHLDYAALITDDIAERSSDGLPVVLAGDFNVFDGFETGEAISFLRDSGLTDLFRAAHPTGDVTTFVGNDWAPSGRLDYLFSTAPVDVVDARVDQVEGASDHYPVIATVQYRGSPPR
jgi:endonuclease/exonuclease/phosphatase family metal-dependent hydrolase